MHITLNASRPSRVWNAFVLPSSSSGTVHNKAGDSPHPHETCRGEVPFPHGAGEKGPPYGHIRKSPAEQSSQSWRSCALTTKPPSSLKSQVRIRQSHMAQFHGHWLHERHSCPLFPHSSNRPWGLNSGHGNRTLTIFRLQNISYRTNTLFYIFVRFTFSWHLNLFQHLHAWTQT